MRLSLAVSGLFVASLLSLSAAPPVLADDNETVAVAIWFVEADGSTKPYYFHDLNDPMPRWSCEPRLNYLTKMFYRMTRSNPDLKDKQAVKSACVALSSID